MAYDCEGWVTKYNLKCSDGLTIRDGAFSIGQKKRVPVVFNHQHGDVSQVLGHCDLEPRNEGVYGYVSFNNTRSGQDAKEQVKHGDVVAFSIWANNVQKASKDVLHAVIQEVSLVLAGANPGAFIESVFAHGLPMGDEEDEAIIFCGEDLVIHSEEPIAHADDPKPPAEPQKEEPKKGEGNKTVKDVLETLNDEQKAAVGIMLAEVSKSNEDEGGKDMKHNAFDPDDQGIYGDVGCVISQSDMEQILKDAETCGSLRKAVMKSRESGVLSHSIDTTGMMVATGSQTYGFNDPSMFFPDYRADSPTPEWISRNMDWVNKLLSKVHRSPFSRIKSMFADITEDEARAKGYIKGNLKTEEVFTTLKRTTDPQTIYKKQKLDRDDIIDIIDFDVVAWIRAEMRIMLNEEIARAILIGDGRNSASQDKIQETHVRPVVSDVPLFNIVVKVSVDADATEADIAEATIKAAIRSRKKYKGSGKPDFWTTDDTITEMLLLENKIGDPKFRTENELATKLRVNEIIPVEVMEGHQVTVAETSGNTTTTKTYPLIGTIINFVDYAVGADKGGQIDMFDDFDIDYNQYKYLIETRISGALRKPFSAITLVLDKAAKTSGGSSSLGGTT